MLHGPGSDSILSSRSELLELYSFICRERNGLSFYEVSHVISPG